MTRGADAAAQFVGEVPQLYDRYLGPTLFVPYADHLVRLVSAESPHSVLEVGAVTGLLAERLAAAMPTTSITATDLNEAMIEYAARTRHAPGVIWEAADVYDLPYSAGMFDVVVCEFAAMFFDDRPAGYKAMGRVLNDDGLLVLAMWASTASNDWARVTERSLAALAPANPPDYFQRVAYGYGDADGISADLAAAGFGELLVDFVSLPGHADAAHLAIGLVQACPLRAEVEQRVPGGLDAATAAVTSALLHELGTGDGQQVRGTLTAIIVQARKLSRED